MKQLKLSWALTLLVAVFGFSQHVRADSITNNFSSVVDYVANGILGETNWDGIYLGTGDLLNSTAGNGVASSLAANTSLQAPPIGYLSVQTIGSDWTGNTDNGFYSWKLVSGDFDVSVQIAPPWQSLGNNFAGLLVRAWNTNQSGARISFTSTNSSENWLALFNAREFSIGEIREATNGANVENTFADGSADTNTTRYYRITRTGDTFAFYDKTNQTDPWNLITNASTGGGYVPASGSVTRGDWHGQPVQVGIAQAVFGRPNPSPVDFFTDFELSGPNVTATLPAFPAAPANLVTSSPNVNGSLTFSWNTNGGVGSILVIRKINVGGAITVNPVQGLTYNWDTNFPDTNTFIEGNAHVVYVGSATNVTISGLGGSNNLYTAQVLSYDNSSGTNIYNTASPATNEFLGSGVPNSVSVNVFPTNIPVGGVGQVQVIATFTTGDQVDVTTDPSTIITSSDPTTVLVNNGILNGLQAGSVTVSASYAGFSGGQLVSVTAPRFTDNFSTPHDYLNNGLPGSGWDGLYDRPGDIVGGNNAGFTMNVSDADAGITSNNVLTVSAEGTDLEAGPDNAFYLFKNMPGDFQSVVHVNLQNHGAYQFAGLVARAYNTTNNSGPYLGREHNMAWWFFDQFSTPVSLRATINNNATEQNLSGTTPVNGTSTMWLLLERLNGTNFIGYYKLNATDPWIFGARAVDPALSNGVPMQIGMAQSMFNPTPFETVYFDSFSLDGAGLIASPAEPIPPVDTSFVMTLNPNITMTLSWFDPIADDGTAPAVARSVVVMRAGAPVSAQPYLALGAGGDTQNPVNAFGIADDNLGSGNYVVYRTTSGDTNQNQQVTVTGLSPGVVYYAAVYTFSGLGSSRTFNTAVTTFANLQDGVLIGLQSGVWPPNGIPLGGVGIPQVEGVFSGGGLADITPAVIVTSQNTNVIVVTNNFLTPITNGSATIQVTYGVFTNFFTVTTRNPSVTDDFSTAHDYLHNGVAGTVWDGLYVGTNIPDTTFVSDPAQTTYAVDASITIPGALTISNLNSGFEFNQDDGTFLFKYVPGDFQMAVDLADYTNNGTQLYNCSGLMVRGYTEATNGTLGAPLDESGNECWIAWERFDLPPAIGTRYESTTDNNTSRPANTDLNGPEHYMLVARVNGTNFYFLQRASTNVGWHATSIGNLTGPSAMAKFTGQPLQAGIMVSGFDSGTPVETGFANYLLDIDSVGALSIAAETNSANLTWPGSPSIQLQSSPSLSAPNWQPVPTGTEVFTNGQFNMTVPEQPGSLFFRLQD